MKRYHDVNAVIDAIKRHWRESAGQADLGRHIQAEFPGIPLDVFNTASEIAWEQVQDEDRREAAAGETPF